jgi:hypothetical protein
MLVFGFKIKKNFKQMKKNLLLFPTVFKTEALRVPSSKKLKLENSKRNNTVKGASKTSEVESFRFKKIKIYGSGSPEKDILVQNQIF